MFIGKSSCPEQIFFHWPCGPKFSRFVRYFYQKFLFLIMILKNEKWSKFTNFSIFSFLLIFVIFDEAYCTNRGYVIRWIIKISFGKHWECFQKISTQILIRYLNGLVSKLIIFFVLDLLVSVFLFDVKKDLYVIWNTDWQEHINT